MAQKQKCPEFENHERWLVSYADMLTLLFAVFVVLYALNMDSAASDEEKLAGSMQEAFNKPLEDIPVDRRVGPDEVGWGIFENMRGNSVRPNLMMKYPSSESIVKTIDSEKERVQIQLENRLYGPEKHRNASEPGQARIVNVQRTQNGFKVQLAARHFFAPGEVTVRREALTDLAEISKILRDLGRSITVEGHTDNVPPSGSYTNWEISALRASSVLRYMIREQDFPPTKISAAGYADMRPVAHNGTESGRAMNRRIEIQIHYDPDVDPPQE